MQTDKRWERAHVHELQIPNTVVKPHGCQLGLLKRSNFSLFVPDRGIGSEKNKPTHQLTRRTDTQRCEFFSPHGNRREGRSTFLTYIYESRHNQSSQTGFSCVT